jgi:8-hydroxy-5-deazaflavin:NADPH oxidoreductase
MKIGIIGAGSIGATLARKLAASGHEVKLANSKGPDTIRDLARDIGATAVSKEEAVQGVAVIVLAIPFGKYPDLASLFNDVPADVVVIDTSNNYPFRDGAVAEVDGGKPESVWVSEQIGRPVVKAWNAVLAVTLAERGQPNGASGRIAIPVAGDARRLRPLPSNWWRPPASTRWTLEVSVTLGVSSLAPPAYCTELTTNELKSALQSVDRSRAPGNRDAVLRELMAAGGKLTHDEIVARNRVVTA